MSQLPLSDTPKRGTRLQPSWIPSDRDVEYAHELGMSPTQITLEAEKFRDYWIALPGQRGTKLDWPATWRNWVRRDYAKDTAAIKTMQQHKNNHRHLHTPESLAIVAQHVKRPWCERGAYPRDVLQACVDAGLITAEQMEEKS